MISPFVLSKALQAAVGTLKSVRRQRNGNVLLETDNRTCSAKLLAMTDITGCPVQAQAHRTLNSSKGVIKCADLKLCKKEEIIEERRPQGVVDSFNITVKSGENNRRPTNTFILTFNTPTAPPHINMDIFELRSTPTFQTP